MSKLEDSLLSGSRGRTDRLVVANVNGTEILRIRPRKRTGEPTPKQALIQTRMKKSYDFISAYKPYAMKYFGQRAGMKSRYIQAMTNVLNAFKLDYTAYHVLPVYPEIEFSRGALLTVVPTALSAPAAATFKVDWYENSGGDALRQTDDLQLLYFAEGDPKPAFLENLGTRLDTTVTVPVAPGLTGKTVHVWLAFRSATGIEVSTSVYVGSVVII